MSAVTDVADVTDPAEAPKLPLGSSPFGQQVANHLNAGFSALWVHSHEQEEVLTEIVASLTFDDYPLVLQWDCVKGLRELQNATREHPYGWVWVPREGANTPEALLSMLSEGGSDRGEPVPINGPPGQAQRCVILVKNLDLLLNGAGRVQMLRDYLYMAEASWSQRFIVLSGEQSPPKPVGEKTFTCLAHPLPGESLLLGELTHLLGVTREEECEDIPEGETFAGIVAAARGLTRVEARNQFSLLLAEPPQELTASRIFHKKRRTIEQQGLGLDVLSGEITFADIGGYDFAKKYVRKMIEASAKYRNDRELKPRGIVLAGVPGCGKSLFSLAVGNSCSPRRPTIRWSPSLTGSKFVSQGAQNQRRVLDIFEQNAPMVIQVDEGEKQMHAGGEDSAAAGQAAEMQAQWLSWHEETTADCYPIFTMNQGVFAIMQTRPEFLARFDAVFFIDVPTRAQKDQIWRLEAVRKQLVASPDEWDAYVEKHGLPNDANWVGRDIGRCCREAKLLEVPLREVQIGDMSSQAAELIKRMRELADGRFMSVDYHGFYRSKEHESMVESALSGTGRRDRVRPRRPGKSSAENN
jgi:hypothetical protein